MEAAAVPSLRAFTLLFVLLSWCAGVIAVTQTIYVPAACAFIVPESAAQWASTIAGLAIASALVGPIFGTIADEMGDILPALIGAITISTAGAVLAIVGCHMINISLFAIGAFLMAAGGLGGVFPLLFAMCGMFGFIVPDRTGSISSAMLLAMTLVQTVSALICALMPLEESHLTYLYFILAGDIVSMVGTAGLACTPLRSLFAPLGDRPNSDGPKVSAISYCTSALRSILIDWTSAAYAPLRLALLAGALALATIASASTMFLYFAEDYGEVDDVQWYYGMCVAVGSIICLFITVPVGKYIDGVDSIWSVVYPVTTANAVCIGLFCLVPLLPSSSRAASMAVIAVLLSIIMQLSFLALVPLFLHLTVVTHKVQRDVTIYQPLQLCVAGLFVPLSGMLVASFGNTAEEMSGDRLKYTLLGYTMFFGLSAVLGLSALAVYSWARSAARGAAQQVDDSQVSETDYEDLGHAHPPSHDERPVSAAAQPLV